MSGASRPSPAFKTRSFKTRSARRAALLEAAMNCVAREGMAKTSMQDIAAEAGVTRMTVYREFGTRKALIQTLIVHRARTFIKQFGEGKGRSIDLVSALREFLLTSVKNARTSALTAELVRGPMVLSKPGLPLHDETSALWRPWLERAQAEGRLKEGLDLSRSIEWILIIQQTVCRLAVEGNVPDEYLRELVDGFIAPAFQADACPDALQVRPQSASVLALPGPRPPYTP